MILLGLDFETDGLDVQKSRVTEVGLCLWDSGIHAPVNLNGFLVKTGLPLDQEVVALNGITEDMLERWGIPDNVALAEVLSWAARADVIVAHNGHEFDSPILASWCSRHDCSAPDMLWLDTRVDLPDRPGTKLIYMAAEDGFVNPFPHRALTDVLTMMRILDRYDIDAVVERAKLPSVLLRALVSYDDRQKAKSAGFQWNPEKRQWLKLVKEDVVQRESSRSDFKVVMANGN